MKVISINIELDIHKERVLSFLKNEKPDVICMQELLEEDFDFFKKELNMDGVFQILTYVKDLVHQEQKNKKEGIAIFAKNIKDKGSTFYFGDEVNIHKLFNDNIITENLKRNKAFVWVELNDENKNNYKFITTHFVITKDGASTPYQLEVLDLFLNKLEKHEEFILCGDMNAPRGKEAFDRLAEKFKDNIPQEYKTSIDQELHRIKGLQVMVDGLFTTPMYKATDVKLVDGISDHMAVVAHVSKNA